MGRWRCIGSWRDNASGPDEDVVPHGAVFATLGGVGVPVGKLGTVAFLATGLDALPAQVGRAPDEVEAGPDAETAFQAVGPVLFPALAGEGTCEDDGKVREIRHGEVEHRLVNRVAVSALVGGGIAVIGVETSEGKAGADKAFGGDIAIDEARAEFRGEAAGVGALSGAGGPGHDVAAIACHAPRLHARRVKRNAPSQHRHWMKRTVSG